MPDTFLVFFALIAMIVALTTLGILVILRQSRVNRVRNRDHSAFFLVYFLLLAILSLSVFIAFIFLRSVVV